MYLITNTKLQVRTVNHTQPVIVTSNTHDFVRFNFSLMDNKAFPSHRDLARHPLCTPRFIIMKKRPNIPPDHATKMLEKSFPGALPPLQKGGVSRRSLFAVCFLLLYRILILPVASLAQHTITANTHIHACQQL
jgi:hypothetical protein